VLVQQEVNRVALLINGSIEILPLAANADVSLVYSPRPTDRASETIPFLLELRFEAHYTSKDRCMDEIDATLSHHMAQVAVA